LVQVQPPHFVVPREVAEDAGLLQSENPSVAVELHDRTVPFPPLYPAQEAHTMTPLSPPGERALPVAPNAAYKGPGADPAEAPGGFLPKATDAVRSWDSTGEGTGDTQGRLPAERRPDEVGQDSLLEAYPNDFAVPGVERERSVRPAEPHTGLAEAEVVDRQALADTKASFVDEDAADVDTERTTDGETDFEQGGGPGADLEEGVTSVMETDAEAAKQTVTTNAGVVPDQGVVTQGAVSQASTSTPGAEPAEPAELEGAYPLPSVADEHDDLPDVREGNGEAEPGGSQNMTIVEIEQGLKDGTLDKAAVREAEQSGKQRKGVLDLVKE
jgi:hypothetical protein